MRRGTAGSGLALALLLAGCLSSGPGDDEVDDPDDDGGSPRGLAAGPDYRAFDSMQARELDLVSDRADRNHLALAFIVPRANTASPSWLGFATSHDAGSTWKTAKMCGDPLRLEFPQEITCPHLGARLTSDPVLLQLADGAFLYVGVALWPQEVTMFASRYEKDALEPAWTSVVSRSAFDFVDGAHMVPAPYMAYYNGKANVMQDANGVLHIVWAADLGADADPPGNTGLPFWASSADGGRTWGTPSALTSSSFTDVGSMYAVGVEAFQTVDGLLHAVWWDSRSNQVYQVTSADGATSFSAPRVIASVVGRTPDAPIDSNNLTRIWTGVDRSGGPWHGSVYLLADDKSDGQRDLVLMISRDNATLWASPVVPQGLPFDNGRDETMARLLVEPTGAISILYPSWEGRERWSPSEMRFARSADGGHTFGDVALSSAANPFHNPGDYNDLDVVPGGVFAVWEDSRGAAAGERWAWASVIQT